MTTIKQVETDTGRDMRYEGGLTDGALSCSLKFD